MLQFGLQRPKESTETDVNSKGKEFVDTTFHFWFQVVGRVKILMEPRVAAEFLEKLLGAGLVLGRIKKKKKRKAGEVS